MCREAGHTVSFATENGERAYADELMISGRELDPWGFIPVIRTVTVVGRVLRAQKAARDAYRRIQQDTLFLKPATFASLAVADYDGVIFPGGHASGMKPYLESETLQRFTVSAFERGEDEGGPLVIGAVCHGVVVLARSRSETTGKSVLNGRKTTALTWDMEKAAVNITKFTRFWDPNYYRTYCEEAGEPTGYRSVEYEVRRALESDADFKDVPESDPLCKLKNNNLRRDTRTDFRASWVVRDDNYISARWPGDAHAFSAEILKALSGS
jgi:putative intracellular protease/amidase